MMGALSRRRLGPVCAAAMALVACNQPPPARRADRAEAASVTTSEHVGRKQRPAQSNGDGLQWSLRAAVEENQESDRAALGTSWGETRESRIVRSPFDRADARSPFATAALFYNDEEGARSMANASGSARLSKGFVDVGAGAITVKLKNGDGVILGGHEAEGRTFIVGQSGERYSILLQSHVPARLEAVVSVDGLDVMDGKAATFGKRGYLIDPYGSIEIDGFRQSLETVAAFRFGSVGDSYVARTTGDARNAGVIGIALFNEKGTNPASWPRNETTKRLEANPFPGQ